MTGGQAGRRTGGQADRRSSFRSILALQVLLLAVSSVLNAQALAERVDGAPDGKITMSFKARPGVCFHSRGVSISSHSDDEWESDCTSRPALLLMTKRNSEIVDIDVRSGGRWRQRTQTSADLGRVNAAQLAQLMIELAKTTDDRDLGRTALMVAASADSADVADDLVEIALDDGLKREIRRSAVFWAGQSDAATASLARMYDAFESRGMKRRAIFVLSQRTDDEAVDKLIDIALNDPDKRLRKKAWFWLGQSRNPKAIQTIARVLEGA